MDADVLTADSDGRGSLCELLKTLLAGNGAIQGEERTMEHWADWDAAQEALNNSVTLVCPSLCDRP